jgi:hypothetical protein
MKTILALLFGLAATSYAQFAVMHTNGVLVSPTNLTIPQSSVSGLASALDSKLGTNPTLAISNTAGLQSALDGKLATNGTLAVSNVSGLQSALDGKLATNGSAAALTNFPGNLLSHGTNGQVIYTNTNTLTFTNRVYQSSTNATNVPETRLITKNTNVASWFFYDADQVPPFTTNNANWHVQWWGLNYKPSFNGQDRDIINPNIGAAGFTIENMYYASNTVPPTHAAEFYFNVEDYGTNKKGTTRAFMIAGSQTDSTVGSAFFSYPLSIFYNTNSRLWAGGDAFGLNVGSTNSGLLAKLVYSGTNANESVLFRMQVQDAATDFFAFRDVFYIRNYAAGRNGLRLNTNGVIINGSQNQDPSAPVHLAGNTRIDGAITFNNTTNAATTRTNLGLGNGITTNVSSGTLQFSNGILIGHTP